MKNKSKKKIWIILGVILAIIIIGSSNNQILSKDKDGINTDNEKSSTPVLNQTEDNDLQNEDKIPTCDGTSVTSD